MSFAKADQLLELATMVAARKQGLTLDEIAEKFGCVKRTAQRMTEALEKAFPDTVAYFGDDGRKRWQLDGAHLREFLTLTPDELAMMDLAIDKFHFDGMSREARSLGRLKDKILALVPRKSKARIETDHEALLEAQGFVARPGPRVEINEAVSEAIAEAIKGCLVLEIDYLSRTQTQAGPRRIEPFGILSGPRRYLVARLNDDPAGAIRTFRIDGIAAARLTDTGFVRPDGFDLQSFANRAFGVYQRDDEFGEVVWRFCPEAAAQARDYLFHPGQTLKDEDDGSLTVRFSASGHLEMSWHLYTWGDKVEVLAPERLRKMVEGYQRHDFAAMP